MSADRDQRGRPLGAVAQGGTSPVPRLRGMGAWGQVNAAAMFRSVVAGTTDHAAAAGQRQGNRTPFCSSAPPRGLALPARGGRIIEDAGFIENRNGRAELSRRYHHRSASARRCPGGAIAPERVRVSTRHYFSTRRSRTADTNTSSLSLTAGEREKDSFDFGNRHALFEPGVLVWMIEMRLPL